MIWVISPYSGDVSQLWYYCGQYGLSDCIEGTWITYSTIDDDATLSTGFLKKNGECGTIMTTTLAPLIANCTPYIETRNFYEEKMDGVWTYNEQWGWYTLNISDSTSHYVMGFGTDQWAVYEQYGDGSFSSDSLTFCEMEDISECGGYWRVYDAYLYRPIYDSNANAMFVDCTVKECAVIGLTVNDTNC